MTAPARDAASLTVARRLHSVEVAADVIGVARSTAYEEIRLRRLRTVRVGRRRLVPTEYIDEYVELLKREAEEEPR
ncbi:excisionase family DNA-binding protein [Streptomyces fildesensis]|uniref:Excisionase family DNA-binding protein n=1 Tax=Streptomyces fildesensis TaxID=375757 RepID=A0ABW8C6X0_9ACTN